MRWECEDISDLDEMPTSIVRIYTPGGFVVAGDCREYNPKTGQTIRDNLRKVFSVRDEDRVLLYALSGTNKVQELGATDETIDAVALIHGIVRELASARHESLWEYANALSAKITQDLPRHEPEDEPTVIYVDGYYKTRPQRAQIKIYYSGQGTPQILCDDPVVGKIDGCGSMTIMKALERSSESTRGYHTPIWISRHSGIDVAGAIELAKSYIGAQCDDEVRKMDKKWYEAIGGVGHLCVLRANGQFEWIYRDPRSKEWKSCKAPAGPTING